MRSEQIRYRSDLINTQVITSDTGKRLGVVKELLVDIDRREVVALGLRDNLISIAGMPRYLLLSSIRKWGDVILVEDDNVIEDIDVDAYSTLINSEVITETGELLGRVRGFKFNSDDGQVASIIIASLGLPLIPEQVLSTYELPVDEIVSSGPNRLIVFEGAEERMNQLTVGVLERLGLGKAPWESEEDEAYFTPSARPENQLGTGIPVRTPTNIRTATPVTQNAWSDDDWEEPQPQPLPRRRQSESIYYEEDVEEDNWSEASTDTSRKPQYQQRSYAEAETYEDDYDYEDEIEGDAWGEDVKPQTYKAPKLNIPEKTKQPEYQDDGTY
ncbi:PRC-barrel domain protein [Crinalium epipsammum PCC 9333]|uniref:PRC-barrel domain protein n=1 Tax=Crinalium epipsammum PCC 9333 TaxID=1173022 RepID=K9VY29_9CYAN|nr:PRC-barrel domain-containing protein [Crinalium epipsammum]AFZ12881.1 PRC-barrel domain protein [Crinalium epipsammum PCC 9333]